MAWNNVLGDAVGNIGTAFGLPEFNISEKLNSLNYKPTAWDTSNQVNQQVQTAYASGTPYTASTIGSVLGTNTTTQPTRGATTGGSTGGSTYSQPTQPTQQTPDPNAFYQNEFGQWVPKDNGPQQGPDLYAEIGGVFDELLGSFGGQQKGLESQIGSLANTQKAGINEQMGFGIESLNQNRGQVRTNQANTLSDLAQNMRDSAQNVGRYIGARGAGNSSANDQASFALQKMFGKERGSVLRQGNDQMFEIDQTETNLKAKTAEMLNGVEQWHGSQMADIARQFNELRNNVGLMKGNMRAQAIGTLYDRVNQINDQKSQYAQAITQQAQDRLAQLNNLKLELGNAARFDPRQMVFQEYGFNPQGSQRSYSDPMFNPMALAQRRKQETSTY